MTAAGGDRAADAGRLFLSPSQLKSFVSCERRWYLESQARAARDSEGGGQYLVYGRLVDEAVERLVAKPAAPLDADDLVAFVKAARRGDELSGLADEKWAELAAKAVAATRRLAGAKLLPPAGTPSQHRYRAAVPGAAVTLVGRADFRSVGRVWDLKTTSDRGPGKGPSAERAPNALTDETLRHDFQARVYAVAEFFSDPSLASVAVRWVYSSSQTQTQWAATAFFTRAETIAWFDSTIRPHFPRLFELAATEGLAPEEARANHDGCARCFIKGSCSPFSGAQHQSDPNERLVTMDLAALRARRAGAINRPAVAPPTPEADLVSTLEASLAPVDAYHTVTAAPDPVGERLADLVAYAAEVTGGTQDDRRADVRDRAAAPPPADVPPTPVEDAPPVVPVAPPAAAADADPEPRRGRGRPRKPRAVESPGAVATVAPTGGARPPTDAELEAIATLDAAAASLNAARETLAAAVVAALDAASAARNVLRARGVSFADADADRGAS